MNAPLREDDRDAKRDEEAECVREEREYAIQRHEQLQRYFDFDPAAKAPQPLPDRDADATRGGGSSAPGGVRGNPWLVRAADIFCRPARPQRPQGRTDDQRGSSSTRAVPSEVPSSPDAAPVDRTGAARGRA